MMLLLKTILAPGIVTLARDVAALPVTMRSVRTTGACGEPFSCVQLKTVPTPTPRHGEVLIRVNATSVNPSDVDRVEGGGCVAGCGADAAGVVVACPGCNRLKVGEAVWGFAQGAYSDYVVAQEAGLSTKPESLDFHKAATLPEVGLTSFMSLKRTGSKPGTPLPTGSPWTSGNFSNLTVVITAGAGGTGFIGIQLAKAWGAKHIATATTGADGFEFVKSLGATFVTDYKHEDIFDVLADNSVDIVYDNYGAEHTADKALRTIRPGGMYLMMPHGECYSKKIQGPPCLSGNPKEGVRQLNYVTGPDFAAHSLEGLNELKNLIDAGQLSPRIAKTFSLDEAAKAFAFSAGHGEGGVGHHFGKIAMTVAPEPSTAGEAVLV